MKGVKRDAATLDATRIRVEDLEIEVNGTMSAVSGCPIPRLTVDGTVIVATTSTTFKTGACADLVTGTKVRARGARQADGSILAYWIWPEVVRRETSAEITGVVSGLIGNLPRAVVHGHAEEPDVTRDDRGGRPIGHDQRRDRIP